MSSLYIPEPEQRTLHMNAPQLRAIAVDAHTQRHVWGRRTGKTEGPGAIYTVRRVHDMPRANGFMVGTTYEQLLTRTIPPLVAAWERLGYHENVHYWIRKAPPAGLRIPRAYRLPLKFENYITWYNGSGIYLVSQDRPGSINGVSTQWGYGDEAKFLDATRLNEEAMLTLSGLAEHFGDHPHYLSTMFMSDMPTSNKGAWLLEAEAQMDPAAVELAEAMAIRESQLQLELEGATERKARSIHRELQLLQAGLAQLRRDLVHFSEATTMDNIHVLGLEPLRNFRRSLSPAIFDASVRNKRIVQVEHGFYARLDEDRHGYDAVNYAHVDSLEFDFKQDKEVDSRWDSDVDAYQPIDIALDYNNIFCSLIAGQIQGREMKMLNSLFVDAPELLQDLVDKFCRYYRHHPTKHAVYFFDHTAIALDATRNLSYSDIVQDRLRFNGWTVDPIYIGQSSSHFARYNLWGLLLRGSKNLPVFQYNRQRAYQWQVCAQGAGTKRVGNEWRKDKDGEKVVKGVPVMPPRLATHLTEAADTWIWGRLRYRLADMDLENATFVDTLM